MGNKKLVTVFYQQRTVPQGHHLINRRFYSTDEICLLRAAKSRRDGTLLTVDFNLRKGYDGRNLTKSRRDGTCTVCSSDSKVSSHAGLRDERSASVIRRLKPTVNQMPSLRDSVAERRRCISLPCINPVRWKTLICCFFFIPKNYN